MVETKTTALDFRRGCVQYREPLSCTSICATISKRVPREKMDWTTMGARAAKDVHMISYLPLFRPNVSGKAFFG